MTNPSIALHYFIPFMRPHACPPCAPSVGGISHMFSPAILQFLHKARLRAEGMDSTYQGLLGTVLSVLVVAAELGVDTLERRVTEGLRLLDTVGWKDDISDLLCLFRGFKKKHNACRPWLEWFIFSRDKKEPLNIQTPTSQIPILPRAKHPSESKEKETVLYAPVTVSLLAVVVLRCVLGLCTKKKEVKSAFPNQTPSVCIVD